MVVKADGLAAGKGVIVAQTLEEAEEALAECFVERASAMPASTVLIEEFLEGEEVLPPLAREWAADPPSGPGPGLQAGSWTATRARTPAAWAPTPRFPAWTTALYERMVEKWSGRPWRSWTAGASTSAGCCTPG